MKKVISLLALILALSVTSVWAVDLNKIANAVGNVATNDNQKNDQKNSGLVFAKLEENLIEGSIAKAEGKLGKIIDRIEGKVARYEEKADKAEKVSDNILQIIESLDSAKVHRLVTIAKYVAITVAAVILILIVLLVLVFVELLKVNSRLKKIER